LLGGGSSVSLEMDNMFTWKRVFRFLGKGSGFWEEGLPVLWKRVFRLLGGGFSGYLENGL